MKTTCKKCNAHYDDASRSTVCPHVQIADPEVLARKDAALKLIGKRVRFRNEESGPSYRVMSVAFDGLVTLEGFHGEFAPHLFSITEDKL